MSLLVQRGELSPYSSVQREERAAGGRWVAFGQPDPAELVAEIKARGVRSLVTFQRDLSFLGSVPQIEFLVVSSDPPDVSPIHDLPALRHLHFTGTWGGRIDFGRLPRLTSFEAVETPRNGGGLDSLFAGHAALESLALRRARLPDLEPLARLRLRSLAITGGLTSLAGAPALASSLRGLSLATAPYLASLDGIEALDRLEVVQLASLRHVTSIEWAARLKRLRLLDIFDQKGIESLRPIAGHSSLEFVTFGRIGDRDLDPLTTIPNLRLIITGRGYRWNRSVSDLPYIHDMPSDDPRRAAYYTALHNM